MAEHVSSAHDIAFSSVSSLHSRYIQLLLQLEREMNIVIQVER